MIIWYDVKKWTPEPGLTYLVCNADAGHICLGYWSVPDNRFNCAPPNEKYEITHWAHINYPSVSCHYR